MADGSWARPHLNWLSIAAGLATIVQGVVLFGFAEIIGLLNQIADQLRQA